MSQHCGYIVKVDKLRKHDNADRLQIATFFNTDVVVGIDTKVGDIGVYFPSDLRLGIEFCEANNLYRKKDENGNNIGGFLDPEKRNVKAIKLRGVKSDGIYCPIKSLETFCDINSLSVGDTITTLNGIVICEKYIPNRQRMSDGINKVKTIKIKPVEYPLFTEHVDTEQLIYNISAFKPGDECIITLKLNGTSARTSNTVKEYYKKSIIDKILHRTGKLQKDWGYISGSRRVVLEDYNGGYYGDNAFRKKWHDFFVGKLEKGEEVFYEIVGYVFEDKPIMPIADNRKLNDKNFVKQFGEKTVYHYGCTNGENDIYVYRITMTNEDGYAVEYPWDMVKYRCEQMGIKYAPELDRFIYTTEEDLMSRVRKFEDIPDPIGKTHISEGVVVRRNGKSKFNAYKYKGFIYKVLEGLIKESATAPDMEESQDI